jgi:phosphoglycolate phosphatase-like HAD superfamily hydrolase
MIKGLADSFLNAKIVILEFEGVVANYTSTERDVSKVLAALAKRSALKLQLLASRDIPELLGALDLTFTELARAGEVEASRCEKEALEASSIKPGLHFLLTAARESGMKTACVGSSATTAIESFLMSIELSQAFDIIIGRPDALAHMLPQPHTLVTVLLQAGVPDPYQAFLVASSEDAAKAASSLRIPHVYLDSGSNKVSPETRDRKDLFVESLAVIGSFLGNVELSETEKDQIRLEELRRKGRKRGLTWPEMVEMFRLMGGRYKSFGNVKHYGYVDEKSARENLLILKHSRREAAQRSLVLEVFASTAIMVEMELRNWFVACKGREFASSDKHTLGQLVHEAKAQGFDASLIARLEEFTRLRNIGIHRVITGEGRYFDVGQDFMKDPAIFEDVKDWVGSQLPSTEV